jgi:ABC-type dipeptide/oligopeptide/nickel transport system permease subunit
MGSAIVLESTLSYLGLGVPFDITSWGRMLVLGKDVMSDAPWIFLPSAILLFLTSFSFIVLGETIRDVFDPKFRSKTMVDNEYKSHKKEIHEKDQ